ncbi:MAG: hypothetical protein AB7O49_12335 [Sphingomonadales bacterium]
MILDDQQLEPVGQGEFMDVERLGGARLRGPGKGDQQRDEKTEQVTGKPCVLSQVAPLYWSGPI